MRHGLILVALCAGVVSASAADMPPRKPGMWELQVTYSPNSPAQTIKQCVDAASDQLMQTTSGRMGRETCSKRDVSKAADGKIVVDAVCSIAGRTFTSQTTITGNLDSEYQLKVVSTSKAEGANKPLQVNIAMAGAWKGPCSGDLAAGDVVLPNGRKFNVLNLPAGEQAKPQ